MTQLVRLRQLRLPPLNSLRIERPGSSGCRRAAAVDTALLVNDIAEIAAGVMENNAEVDAALASSGKARVRSRS